MAGTWCGCASGFDDIHAAFCDPRASPEVFLTTDGSTRIVAAASSAIDGSALDLP